MSEKKQRSEFTCNVMNRISQREKLTQNQFILTNLQKALNSFGTQITNLSNLPTDLREELRKQTLLMHKLIEVSMAKTSSDGYENNKHIESLLESIETFK